MILRQLRGLLAATLLLACSGAVALAGGVSPLPVGSPAFDFAFGSTVGGMLCRTSAGWGLVAAGSANQVLTVPSGGGCPTWANMAVASAGGGVTTSGSPAAGQIAQFSSATAITGINAVPVSAGGTGAATPAGARSGLGAAASGANSDITALSGLTAALPTSEGGTGASSAAANLVLAGPTSGAPAAPAFRALGTADLPLSSFSRDGLKNRLLNPAFSVDQRGNGAAATFGTPTGYAIDRWGGWLGSTTTTVTAQRTAVMAGAAAYVWRLQRASGSTYSGAVNVAQPLESAPNIDLQGQAVTRSLLLRAGTNFSGSLSANIVYGTGTDQGLAALAAGNWTGQASLGAAAIVPTTSFGVFALNYTIPAGATQLAVLLTWTPSGTAGSADYLDLAYDQLEVGTFTAAQVTFERRPFGTELALCQRFFQNFVPAFARGTVSAANLSIDAPVYFKVSMRAVPTLGPGGTSFSANNVSSENAATATVDGFRYEIVATNANTDTYTIGRQYSANAEMN